MVRPKKHLGQHFLTDVTIAGRITDLLQYTEENEVIEIGPGKGILSAILMKKKIKRLKFVEIDHESVEYLENQLGIPAAMITEGDFLNLDLFKKGESYSIIGNFPYNISSQIFFRILDFKDNIGEVVCMIQREVAQRIASRPGNKQYGILSVLLQAWFDIRLEFNVKPGSFFPPPAVHSSVIRLQRNSRKDLGCDELLFKRIVKSSFNQRRKVLSNSLADILVNLNYANDISGLRRRPEELSVEDFIDLCKGIEKLNP